jgi:sortase A
VGVERTRRWMRGVERLLFAIAAVAFVWYGAVRMDASREQAALSRELESSRATLTRTSVPTPANGPAAPGPPAARSLVGRIDVPRLHLSTLAREGVDTRTLRGSAGHVPGSAMPGQAGNAAFAAHRDTFFRPLSGVRKGDEITVTTPTGEFRYVVSATRVVDPADVSVLRATAEATLSLVTCYPFDYIGSAPQRFIVSARLEAGAPLTGVTDR